MEEQEEEEEKENRGPDYDIGLRFEEKILTRESTREEEAVHAPRRENRSLFTLDKLVSLVALRSNRLHDRHLVSRTMYRASYALF